MEQEIEIPDVGDVVEVTSQASKTSKHLDKLRGLKLKVIRNKLNVNLGDLVTNVLYLDTSINTKDNKIVENPYLMEDFKKV